MNDSRRLQNIYDNRFDTEDPPYRRHEEFYGVSGTDYDTRHPISSGSRSSLYSGRSSDKKFFKNPTSDTSSVKYGTYNDRGVQFISNDPSIREYPGHRYNLSTKTYDEIPAYRVSNMPPPLPKPRKKNRPDSGARKCGIALLVVVALLLIGGGLTYLILYATGKLDSNDIKENVPTTVEKQDERTLRCPSASVVDIDNHSKFSCTIASGNITSTTAIMTEMYYRRDPYSTLEELMFNISMLATDLMKEANNTRQTLRVALSEEDVISVTFYFSPTCEDRGVYRIAVTVDGRREDSAVNVKINAPPNVVITGPNVGVFRSRTMVLMCTADATCFPSRLTWFSRTVDSQTFSPVQSGLPQDKSNKTDTGEYITRAPLMLEPGYSNMTTFVCAVEKNKHVYFDSYDLILLPDDFCEIRENGLHAHPFLCQQYITCSSGLTPDVKTCPNDLMFNSESNQCDYERNVNCTDNLPTRSEVNFSQNTSSAT